MSTHIPSSEIKQPSFHADELGFVFIWNGHLLRGVFPDAVKQARRYFESGFVEEIVNKKFFPKTWISDFENEQFGMIIEHEMISPVIYATEWNFQMLKDAALMVLEIAQIGEKYGYNMIDCHKLNVLFKGNKPIYVDLGSFIPKEQGSTGWRPYSSFLRSYYFIIDLWCNGCELIAKRMMAPHLELTANDYWLYKRSIYRHHRKLLQFHLWFSQTIQKIAISGEGQFKGKKVYIKKLVDKLRLSRSQNLNIIRKRIISKNLPDAKQLPTVNLDWLCVFLQNKSQLKTVTFVNCGILDADFLKHASCDRVLSINNEESISRLEYKAFRDNVFSFQSLCYDVFCPSFTYNKNPEKRFCSDLLVLGNVNIQKENRWSIHNALMNIKVCESYTLTGYMAIITNEADVLVEMLPHYCSVIELINNQVIILEINFAKDEK